jgi:uncharacterized repeat protein (TIGR04138 family)
MDDRKLQPLIREIRITHQRRYAEAAYFFVLEALDYTIFLESQDRGIASTRQSCAVQHISPQELLDGLRRYAQEEFGPLAPYAFRSWGVTSTEDFGILVFQMCEAGLLNKTDQDRPKDFANGFDFSKAFSSADPISGS